MRTSADRYQEVLDFGKLGIAVAADSRDKTGRPQDQYRRRQIDDDIIDIYAGTFINLRRFPIVLSRFYKFRQILNFTVGAAGLTKDGTDRGYIGSCPQELPCSRT